MKGNKNITNHWKLMENKEFARPNLSKMQQKCRNHRPCFARLQNNKEDLGISSFNSSTPKCSKLRHSQHYLVHVHQSREVCINLVVTYCWVVWYIRNKFIFERKKIDLRILAAKIELVLETYQRAWKKDCHILTTPERKNNNNGHLLS